MPRTRSSTDGMSSELPSDLLIFSPAVVIQALCSQYDANGRPGRARLGLLVLVVGEAQVDAAAVDVEGGAEVLAGHRRALDVPARDAPDPTARATRRSAARSPSSSPSTARSRGGPACRAGRRRRRAPCPRPSGGSARRRPASSARRSRRRRCRPRPRRRGRGRSSCSISSTISGTWPVAPGSYVGGSTLIAASALSSSRFIAAARAYQWTPCSADLVRILSSMSVTLRMKSTV